MKKIQKTLKALVGTASLALFSIAGHATLIQPSGGTAGSTINLTWNNITNTGAGSLTGSGSITVDASSTASNLILDIYLTNTSTVSGDVLTAFGIGIDPNATGVSFTQGATSAGSSFVDAGLTSQQGVNFPSYQTVDACAWGGQSCSGGGGQGGPQGVLANGGFINFKLNLAGTWGDTVTIDPIAFKYQTQFGSFEFGPSTSGTPTTNGFVPAAEPNSLSLLGLGMVACLFALRRGNRHLQV